MKSALSLRRHCASFGYEPDLNCPGGLSGALRVPLAVWRFAVGREYAGHLIGLVALIAILVTAGCKLLPERGPTPPAAAVILAGGAQLNQTGSAETPAKVTSDTVTSTVPVPAGSTLTLDEKEPGKFRFTFSKDSLIKLEARKESAEAPKAFTPPAPPTPLDVAAAESSRWFYVGLVAGAAAGLFGLVRGWDFVMYGGGAVAAACLFGIFVQKHPLILAVIGVGIALAVIGPTLWHWKLKHLEPKSP